MSRIDTITVAADRGGIVILVTGATGNVGRTVVNRLASSGVGVRALARHLARDTVPAGVQSVQGDLTQPATLRAAFSEIEALFLLLAPGVDPASIVEVARRSGVRYITMLGSLTAQTHPDSPAGSGTLHAERLLRDSGLSWTSLRAWEFASNALAWATSIRGSGTVEVAHAGRPSPTIDPADIGAVAATVLTNPEGGEHDGQIYPLTGPEEVTVADKVGAIGAAIGRDLTLIDRNDTQALANAFWLPGVCTIESPGVHATVEELTGSTARTFVEWANDHADSFRS